MVADISESNPHLDQMRERGWAWVATNGRGKYGAPHTDDEYAEGQVMRYHRQEGSQQELRIISWEQETEE